MKKRENWIDWAKTIGMFTIIWGHCFPDKVSGFIYAFNVPLFFIISGYLCHKESSFNLFCNKIIHNLIIPYFVLGFIKIAPIVVEHLSDGLWMWPVLALFGGFHQLNDIPGCGNLWFVYSLIIIKLLYQCFPRRKLFLSVISFTGAMIYNIIGLEWSWAVTDILLAIPFFMIGNYMATISIFSEIASKVQVHAVRCLFIVGILIVLTGLIGYYNGDAYMYQCHYGKTIILFVLGAVFGCSMIFIVSWMLNGVSSRIISISSIGTIVTLAFHVRILHLPINWISKQGFDVVTQNISLFVCSILVLVAFVPVILFVKRFFPIVLGKRAKSL